MDCKEVKNKIFDFCEQHGPLKLNNELMQHIAGCRDCEIFYEHLVKVGFEQVEQEKQAEINPYFTNKIMLKITQQNSPVFEKAFFLKTPVYITSILLAGILTGILIDTVALNTSETTVEQTVKTEDTNADANTSSDNATLTLNDW